MGVNSLVVATYNYSCYLSGISGYWACFMPIYIIEWEHEKQTHHKGNYNESNTQN